MRFPYTGSGPYCYANSLVMVLGDEAPAPSAVEVLTGSPFGFHLADGLAWFDPFDWDPGRGLDAALDLLGWTCDRTSGGSAADAVERLRAAGGPVLVGPVEMGLLGQHPEAGSAIGADHFVVVLGIADGLVVFHDPHGFPFSTLPVAEFRTAWGTVDFSYAAEPFTMRTRFRRVREVALPDALRAALPAARRRLSPDGPGPAAAVDDLARAVAAGLDARMREHLMHFAVKVGARRLADAAAELARLGLGAAAAVAERQAHLVGGLQHPLVRGDADRASALLTRLAPTYAELDAAFAGAGVPNGALQLRR